jgi:hypothetical protein
MCTVWGEMGDQSVKPGHIAYARQKAAMFKWMAEECNTAEEGQSLVDHVHAARPSLERRDEKKRTWKTCHRVPGMSIQATAEALIIRITGNTHGL